ncbi:cysteine desulfurase [Desulfacinum hydrothermale DSM 13146]|uniref:cysteine desulfurase n=1 Tax=Desulfacinum hydrothermale DSM 13146 TaxID=1121390 RepID=A0A1W1XBN0_9BACT|nr:cysteine desulfurase family protein [Desulfacinum hydrothermale]SMC21194.1 cysteine desulfurase [Desulfacinum hydrothermale DSM 13146]
MELKDPVYLDYNATTPIDPRVAEAMGPCLGEVFGNPSSSHAYGRRARRAVEEARQQVAALLGCEASEVVFTSGGTESNNMALLGVARALASKGRHVVTSSIEHPAVLEPCLALLEDGFDVTFVPVDGYGRVDPDDILRALRPDTILVSLMHSNNEVGTLQPVAELAGPLRERGILFHTDAAQSVGKVPTRVADLGVDLLTVAGHKLYAPKGVGALYVRSGTPMDRVLYGAGQEGGRRPGTENVLEIVGLGAAAQCAARDLSREMERLRSLRDRLEAHLLEKVPDARVNGHPRHRLPNTLSISFPGLTSGALLAALPHVAASGGAACHSDGVRVSHVLEAMGLDPEVARGTLRLSVGRFTDRDDVDRAAEAIVCAVGSLKEGSN